ncbi:MAG: hypothetical protein AAF703_24390, partial [Cyanobacteria bacterium P01_D01_bin.105]
MKAPSLHCSVTTLLSLLSSSLIPLMIPAPTKAEALPPLPIQFSAEAASRGRVGSASGGCHERD